jgi:hypothetical protein
VRIRAPLAYLLPSLGNTLWMAVFFAVIGMGPRMMNVDGDLGRHLTIGRHILASGQIPTADLFSHTMSGAALTPHEWLAQVVFAVSERWLGLDGPVLVCALVIATAFWLVFRRIRKESGAVLLPVMVVVLAMAASSLHWLTRPHVFTFLLLALWVAALEDLRCGQARAWWRLPVLMLFWVNLHGAFIAGFVTWVLYAAGMCFDRASVSVETGSDAARPAWRSFLLGGAAAGLVTFVNPSGLGTWLTSVGYVGTRYLVDHTAEYLPPDFHDASTWPFLAFAGLLVAVFGLKSRRIPAAHVFTAAAWLVMALYSVRNVPLFVIVAAPALVSAVNGWLTDTGEQSQSRLVLAWLGLEGRLGRIEAGLKGMLWPAVFAALILLALIGGANLDFDQRGNQFDPEVFPVDAVDWLAEHPPQGVGFNHFPWGGYLLYRLWPEERVFIDGQTDFYGEALTRQYEQVITLSPGWESVIDQYAVGWVLVPPDSPLANELVKRTGWQVVYEDETAVVMVSGPE